MEEIIKRLEILKLSIALKDTDSIDLQINRLEKLNVNQQVHNIIALIKNRQFYHAMMSINAYPNDLYSSEYYGKIRAQEEAIIEEFDLFESTPKGAAETITPKAPVVEKIEDETQILEQLKAEEEKLHHQEEIIKEEEESRGVIRNSWFVDEEERVEESTKEDQLKEEDLSQKDTLGDNEQLVAHEEIKEDKEEELSKETEPQLQTDESQEVKEEDKEEEEEEPENNYNSWYEDSKIASQIDTTNPLSYTKDYTFDEPQKEIEPNTYEHNLIMDDDLDDIAKDYYRQKLEEDIEKVQNKDTQDEERTQESSPTVIEEEDPTGMDEDGFYQPIQFLDQKFKSILNRFPQKEPIESDIDSIKHIVALFEKPYSEEEIDIALKQLDEFKKNEEYEEAAKILLVVANTQSQNAHFRLARELFKGDVLEQNYPEAFIQMNDLALDGYVEAICDLGQFYEYGIGIKKDRKKALSLYDEAHELGLERAKELHDKLENSKKNFFSYLFN
jgi:hypothetical protein